MVPNYNSDDHHHHQQQHRRDLNTVSSSIDRTLSSFFYPYHSLSKEEEEKQQEEVATTAQFSIPTRATTTAIIESTTRAFSNSNSTFATTSLLSSKSSEDGTKVDNSDTTNNKEDIVSNVVLTDSESTSKQQDQNVTSDIDSKNPTEQISTSATTQQTFDSYQHHHPHHDNENKYWRYDEASPRISKATTHLLVDSIPQRHRLPKDFNFDDDFDTYLSNKQNKWPSKLHLFEMNPCIAVLPEHDRRRLLTKSKKTDFDSRRSNNGTTASQFGGSSQPVYIASYRVTHLNNCFSSRSGSLNMLFDGASFDDIRKIKTDYLGIAILDHDLNIISSQVVTFDGPQYPFRSYNDRRTNVYDDYRVHNLHGDQLYLSTRNMIIPLYLNLDVDRDIDFVKTITKMPGNKERTRRRTMMNRVDQAQYVMIPSAFPEASSSSSSRSLPQSKNNHFSVFTRSFPSCGVYGESNGRSVRRGIKKTISNGKNFLYFVDDNGKDNDSTDGRRSILSNSTSFPSCKLLHYPRWNPNDVRVVELDTLCGRQQETEYDLKKIEKFKSIPLPSFRTIDEQYYPKLMKNSADNITSPLFMNDRGSACCIKMVDPTNGKTVLVGISHPKTPYPGKKLPKDVEPNTYLSRFFAFEPHYPYNIVARSGMFCFGYPTNNNGGGIDSTNDGRGDTYLSSTYKMAPLQFANITHNCPKIHFVTGIIEKVSIAGAEDSSKRIIISYGISDCLSRFIEVDKTEIAKLLWSTPS